MARVPTTTRQTYADGRPFDELHSLQAKLLLKPHGLVTLAAVVFVVVLRTRVNPALMVLAGAVAGILAFVVA